MRKYSQLVASYRFHLVVVAAGYFFLLLHEVGSAAIPYSQDPPVINPERSILQLVEQWNTANKNRDTNGLSLVYAYDVGYYGETMPREEAIMAKYNFFKKHPAFSQTISEPIVAPSDNGLGFVVYFTKTITERNKVKRYDTYLVIDTIRELDTGATTSWKIVIEGDHETDSLRLAALMTVKPTSFTTCSDVVLGIVQSAPKARSHFYSTSRLVLDRIDDEGKYHVHLYERPPLNPFTRTFGWYTFDPVTKQLTSQQGEALTYDRSLLTYVKKFCH